MADALILRAPHKVRSWAFLLAALLLAMAAAPARAANCTTPVNLLSNGSFASGLAGFGTTGAWQFNQSLSSLIYGTTYNRRAAVINSSAAPTGSLATNYPAASTNAFVINETDTASADSLTPTNPTGAYTGYTTGTTSGNNTIDIWFDLGWRQAGGATSNAASLAVRVNGTTHFTVTTINGTGAGNATGVVSNGATLGTGVPTAYANPGGNGALSSWYTIRLTVPYTGTSLPTITFAMTGGGSVTASSDDFAIDRIYVPVCPVTTITTAKSSTVISDPVNGTTNPKAMPGATLRYCIQVTNPSTEAAADSVAVSDSIASLPVNLVAGSIRLGGTVTSGNCNWNGTAGGSFASGTVSGTIASIPAGQVRTLYFDVTLN